MSGRRAVCQVFDGAWQHRLLASAQDRHSSGILFVDIASIYCLPGALRNSILGLLRPICLTKTPTASSSNYPFPPPHYPIELSASKCCEIEINKVHQLSLSPEWQAGVTKVITDLLSIHIMGNSSIHEKTRDWQAFDAARLKLTRTGSRKIVSLSRKPAVACANMRLFALWIFIALLLCISTVAAGEKQVRYHLKGRCSLSQRTALETNAPLEKLPSQGFDLYVSDGRYAIKTFDPLSGAMIRVVGNNEETLSIYRGASGDEIIINNSAVPRLDVKMASVIWFGLGSSDFFKMTAPKYRVSSLEGALTQDKFARFNKDKSKMTFGGLPMIPGSASIWMEAGAFQSRFPSNDAPSYKFGFPCVDYQVVFWTYFDNYSLPGRVVFKELTPTSHATSSTDVVSIREYDIHVDEVSLNIPNDAFAVSTRDTVARVADYRVYETVPIYYSVTNSQWLPKSELPKPDPAYKAKMERDLGIPNMVKPFIISELLSSHLRAAFFAALGFVLVVFVLTAQLLDNIRRNKQST
jgi:hypothetical protein